MIHEGFANLISMKYCCPKVAYFITSKNSWLTLFCIMCICELLTNFISSRRMTKLPSTGKSKVHFLNSPSPPSTVTMPITDLDEGSAYYFSKEFLNFSSKVIECHDMLYIYANPNMNIFLK
jgi:hypothetical protein